jgi:hypothetical protein
MVTASVFCDSRSVDRWDLTSAFPDPDLDSRLELTLDPWASTARAIVGNGMWCAIEACIAVAAQRWEPVLLICSGDEQQIDRALAAWIADSPEHDLRICGYTRDTLRRVEGAPRALCYLAPEV